MIKILLIIFIFVFYSTSAYSGVVRTGAKVINKSKIGVTKRLSDAIYGFSNVQPAFVAATTEKIAFVGIGDSNQIKSGTGWDHGLAYGLLNAGYTMYSGGLHACTSTAGQGYNSSGKLGFVVGASSGAPSALDDYYDGGSGGLVGNPQGYDYADDTLDFSNNNNGYSINKANMNVNNAWQWQVYYGTFLESDGAGQMKLSIRYGESPFTNLATGSAIDPVTGSYGISLATLDLSAATRNLNLNGQIYNSTPNFHLLGPTFLLYMRMVDTTVTKGFAYQSLLFRSGKSLRDLANDLIQASNNTLSQYFSAVRSGTTNNKVVVTINGGVNDRNEASASLGPLAIADGDSPEAFADNAQAIVNRIQDIYDLNEWATTNLYFILLTTHIISNPDDAELITYRNAAETIFVPANSTSASVRLDRLARFDEMNVGNGGGTFYASGGDITHLS